MDKAQKGALRLYAWAIWFGAVAWFVTKLADYSAAHGGTDQSWFFLNTFAVIALAPKGIQGTLFTWYYRPDYNRSAEIRLALYGGIWWLLLIAGISAIGIDEVLSP